MQIIIDINSNNSNTNIIQSEKWRNNLILSNQVDVLDSVNKWYYATIIDIDENTKKIKL